MEFFNLRTKLESRGAGRAADLMTSDSSYLEPTQRIAAEEFIQLHNAVSNEQSAQPPLLISSQGLIVRINHSNHYFLARLPFPR